MLISSGLLVQSDEGVSDLVVDRIDVCATTQISSGFAPDHALKKLRRLDQFKAHRSDRPPRPTRGFISDRALKTAQSARLVQDTQIVSQHRTAQGSLFSLWCPSQLTVPTTAYDATTAYEGHLILCQSNSLERSNNLGWSNNLEWLGEVENVGNVADFRYRKMLTGRGRKEGTTLTGGRSQGSLVQHAPLSVHQQRDGSALAKRRNSALSKPSLQNIDIRGEILLARLFGSMSSVIGIIFLILLSSCADSVSAASSIGYRSLLRLINDDKDEKPDFAVELDATNFDSLLKETPASFAVVEFFANWCPACRNYKPQYEKVAKLFNGPDAAHPGIVLMTRVDCALKVNNNLCSKFSVEHYPMLLWAPPSKFVAGSWGQNQDKSEIQYVEDGQTADRLLNWINKKMNSSYSLSDEKYENEHLQRDTSDPGQIARAIYDIEEATFTALDIILKHKMIKAETQASLIRFFQLLVVHHPSRRCRKGTAQILVDFDDFSVKTREAASGGEKSVLENYQICGNDVPRGYWMFCRGSNNETRGFSCGLWVLLHSLSVRVDDGGSHVAFSTICDFIQSFFVCQECRQHFYDMCSRQVLSCITISLVTHPFKKARDFALWLWDAHNKVNDRLMKEEAKVNTGDPEFPKILWPPQLLCPSCYKTKSMKDDDKNGVNWDRDEVYRFLVEYYGKTLVSLYKDKELVSENTSILPADDITATAHAVAVPVGAALAIAVASCAFGALACYWRQQQKSRKYKHYLHSLKSI
ncbi:sulfhydryl oxidase 2 [Dorcoceras hygrometricum]|uniref:Sulfhydryl oxidase n=1 Tax=Dorcoceras hygrometricum TaxID=472368 RepID=A0A2Z7CZ56_9LAMI|nr:sulfhydryl oxidase 2 [Dorcoceras hygrometricum]